MDKNDTTYQAPIVSDKLMGIMALGYYDKKKSKPFPKEYDSWKQNEQMTYEHGRQLMALLLAGGVKPPLFDIFGCHGAIPHLVAAAYYKALRTIPRGHDDNFTHFNRKA